MPLPLLYENILARTLELGLWSLKGEAVDAQNKFSNIKLVYLPPNTTSEVQPLDLGIIQNTKVHYRKYFLRCVLSKIEKCINATEVAKSVDVLSGFGME